MRPSRRTLSSPRAALRRSVKESRPLESATTQPRHKRPRPCRRYAVSIRRRNYRSLWFLFAEFLEAWIIPKRIEHWIEPEQRGSERQATIQKTAVRHGEQFLQSNESAIGLPHLSCYASYDFKRARTGNRILF